jgi:TolB protein
MAAYRIVVAIAILFPICVHASEEIRLDVTVSTPAPILALAPTHAEEGLENIAQQVDQVLLYDLDFSKAIRLDPDKGRVAYQAKQDRASGRIDYAAWKSLNVQYMVTPIVHRQSSNQAAVDVLVYDILDGRQIMGKRITANPAQLRDMLHKISDAIVFQCTREDGIAQTSFLFVLHSPSAHTKEICRVDYDGWGKSLKPLTRFGTVTQFPAWSPDGRRFAFSSFRSGWLDAYIQEVDTGKFSCLAKSPGNNLTPSWFPTSPDWLAISLSFTGNAEIYSLRRDGKKFKRLTNDRAIDTSPIISPDGKQIAFTSDRAKIATVYIMNSDGSNVRRLVSDRSLSCDTAQWSPAPIDGQYQIAFRGYRLGQVRGDIFTIAADGTGMSNLTRGQGDNSNPTWSPDGEYIAFSSIRRTRKSTLWVMERDGNAARELLALKGNCLQPAWSPCGKN